MKEQCEFLDSLGFKATYIGRDGSDESSILQGEHDFLFTSPENILGDCKWRDMVTSSSSIHLIVVDEAHTVLQWGETVTDDEPFRAWYGKLGEIRSLISCPVLLITATANKAARMKLQQKFCMKGCHEIISNPDRSNIKLFVHKYKSSMPLNILLNFLVEKVTTEKGLCDRYIIFCPSIKLCSEVFTMFRMELGSDIKHVQMYHSKTTDEVKEHIKSDMGKVNGDVRVLVATSAAGMGVNFIGVNQVINLGPPKSMDSFLQQFGRAGRDGSQSMAMLLYSGRQCTNIDDDVKCYIQNDTICRRKVVLEAYNAKPSLLEKHLCCDICQNNCTCGGENCSNFEHAFHSRCNEDSFSESSSDSSLESNDSDT